MNSGGRNLWNNIKGSVSFIGGGRSAKERSKSFILNLDWKGSTKNICLLIQRLWTDDTIGGEP